MGSKRTGVIIAILSLLVIVLLALVVYSFVLKPAVNGYVINAQNQGVQYTVLTIMQQASTCQPVPLNFENQTMNLIWVDCLQQK